MRSKSACVKFWRAIEIKRENDETNTLCTFRTACNCEHLATINKYCTIDITAGVLQGDTLAPFLFIIVLDYALRKALADGKEEELGFTVTPRRSRRHPKEALADLDFADDIALLSDAVHQAQELLLRVETE